MKKILAILAAIAMVGVATTAMAAADWSFYGSARLTTNYTSLSKDAPSNPMPANYDDSDTVWALQGNSRIGANVSAGDVSGRFEYGTGVNVRLLYGVWNFGSGKMLVGQDYSPSFLALSGQALGGGDNNLLNLGEFYAGRNPQIKFIFGNFDLALVTPTATNTGAAWGAINTDILLPKIEAAYKFSSDMFWVKLYGGYQTYDVVNALDSSKSLKAYMFGVGGAFTMGAATIKANIFYDVNPVDYGATAATASAPTDAVGVVGTTLGSATFNGSNEFDDTKEMGAMLLLNYKASDMVSVEVGGAYKTQELDVKGLVQTKFERSVYAFYFQVPLTLAPGVFIIPEFAYYSFGDMKVTGIPDVKLGNQTQFGAKWQINF